MIFYQSVNPVVMEKTSGSIVGSPTTSLSSDASDGDPSNRSDRVEVAEIASDLPKGILEENYRQEVDMKLERTNSTSGSAELIKSQTKATYVDTDKVEKCCIKVSAEWQSEQDVGEILKKCPLSENREHWQDKQLTQKLSDPSSRSNCVCFRLLNFFTNQYSTKDLTSDFIQCAKEQIDEVEFNCFLSIHWCNHFKLILVTFLSLQLLKGQRTFEVEFTLRSFWHTNGSKRSNGLYLLIKTNRFGFNVDKIINFLSLKTEFNGLPKVT